MATRGPLCAGIDPHPSLLSHWGLNDDATGLERFSLSAVEALAPVVPAIKPQSAFFERHGAAGVAVLEKVISRSQQAGAEVILDVKRGDIGSTSQAYADAYLGSSSPLAGDAVTVSPYLGFGSLQPFLDTALRHDRGVFVLALTSNPEAAEVQRARGLDASVAGKVLAQLAQRNREQAEATGCAMGNLGAVVGATIGDAKEDLDIAGPLLVPGVGAQGGTGEDVRRIFAGVLERVLPSTSRALLAQGPDERAMRRAARQTVESFAEMLLA